jgi:prevent-host-death family protein
MEIERDCMRTYNIREAKTQLSKLVKLAAAGESFVIAKAGKPLVKVTPIESADAPVPKRLGFMAGEIQIPPDFDEMGSEEIAEMFGVGP